MTQPCIQCIVVLGPTATGKTRLAVALARRFNGDIISADSRQVYRGLDIGTGKDLAEYRTGGTPVSCHLIDIVDAAEEYHLFRFLADATAALRQISGDGRLPIIAGGTPLYLNALIEGYSPEGSGPDPRLRRELEALSDSELLAILEAEAPDVSARTDRTQRRRLVRAVEIARSRADSVAGTSAAPLNALLLGPYYPRATVHRRVEERLDERLRNGLIEEVRNLRGKGLDWERLDYFGLEYRYVSRYLQGQMCLDEMRNILLAKIRRFCKAQDVWFRKMEREGKVIYWIPEGDLDTASTLVRSFLAGDPLPTPEIRLKDTFYGPRSN